MEYKNIIEEDKHIIKEDKHIIEEDKELIKQLNKMTKDQLINYIINIKNQYNDYNKVLDEINNKLCFIQNKEYNCFKCNKSNNTCKHNLCLNCCNCYEE